jgi:hypothetical protein
LIMVWFIESHIVFTIYLFICICGVKSTLFQLSKQKSYFKKRKKRKEEERKEKKRRGKKIK